VDVTRIIGGEAKGRRLRTPAGNHTRPTPDRVREALFSTAESHLGTLAGRRFLDLFAGSGAVGLEARSRGADHVLLVEHDRAATRLIEDNARSLGFDDVEVRLLRAERLAVLPPGGGPFDVVFLDPPYDVPTKHVGEILGELRLGGWLGADALIVVERRSKGESWAWPEGFEALQSKRYGETMLWYGQQAAADH
jgi:16S rRNA (guanine966-N2)-methyltransferase